MASLGGGGDFNHILAVSAVELSNYQKSFQEAGKPQTTPTAQKQSLSHLMRTIKNTNAQLAKAIERHRVIQIDPKMLIKMEEAIHRSMAPPKIANVRMHEAYEAALGRNTPLWRALRGMQELLHTIDFLSHKQMRKTTESQQIQKEKRRRRKKENGEKKKKEDNREKEESCD